LSKFALRSSYAGSCPARDFPQKELLVGMAVEQRKNRPSALAEKDVRERSDGRTHFGYKCT
jgi:hypothetical protein